MFLRMGLDTHRISVESSDSFCPEKIGYRRCYLGYKYGNSGPPIRVDNIPGDELT